MELQTPRQRMHPKACRCESRTFKLLSAAVREYEEKGGDGFGETSDAKEIQQRCQGEDNFLARRALC